MYDSNLSFSVFFRPFFSNSVGDLIYDDVSGGVVDDNKVAYLACTCMQ